MSGCPVLVSRVLRDRAGILIFHDWREVKIPTLPQKAREGWGTRKSLKGGNELQFRIKHQDYFLAFIEDEKRWYVIAPMPEGVHRIPVYVDAVKYGTPAALGTETTLSS